MSRFCFRGVITVLCILVLGGAPLTAQTSRGTVLGIVTDQTGAVISNAEITLTQIGTNVARTTKSNDSGVYRFDAVDLGAYTITAKADGFSAVEVKGSEVKAARETAINLQLKAGGVTESVTVEGSGEQVLQTTEQVRVANIESRKIADLPIVGQDSLNLITTLPGAVQSDLGGSMDSGIGAINGSRPRANNFLIDGVENNDISVAGPAITVTNQDAIQEVSI